MKIKFSKDYSWVLATYEYDMKRAGAGRGESITILSNYGGTWEEADVTIEQLKEYVERGYAIKINC